MTKKKSGPRILILDIESLPLTTYTWALFDQNIPLNMVKEDWSVLSWAAKWLDDPPGKMMYADQRNAKNVRDDKKMLEGIWNLMDEADVVIGQNSNSFDIKKLNARFVMNGMKPPTTFKKIDTKLLAKKHFAFTSNKLEFMAEKINKKYKKLSHKSYPGFSLWLACMAGDKKAWPVLKEYNCHDVLATEELYKVLRAWDNVNFDAYHDELEHTCVCGNNTFKLNGFAYTATSKVQRFVCKACGKESRSKVNLLDKDKRKSIRK